MEVWFVVLTVARRCFVERSVVATEPSVVVAEGPVVVTEPPVIVTERS